MSQYNIAGYGVFNESAARQFMVAGYGLVLDTTSGASADVTPEPAYIAGVGDQPAPTISGSAVNSPAIITQLAEAVDPTLSTTRNLSVGNYRSSTVTMNW
jgi:hypothetical protein